MALHCCSMVKLRSLSFPFTLAVTSCGSVEDGVLNTDGARSEVVLALPRRGMAKIWGTRASSSGVDGSHDSGRIGLLERLAVRRRFRLSRASVVERANLGVPSSSMRGGYSGRSNPLSVISNMGDTTALLIYLARPLSVLRDT